MKFNYSCTLVSSPWRWPDYLPKHVGECIMIKKYIIKLKCVCWLFIHFTKVKKKINLRWMFMFRCRTRRWKIPNRQAVGIPRINMLLDSSWAQVFIYYSQSRHFKFAVFRIQYFTAFILLFCPHSRNGTVVLFLFISLQIFHYSLTAYVFVFMVFKLNCRL